MAYTGDTVRMKVYFRSLEGNAINPNDVTLTLFDKEKQEIESMTLDTSNQEDEGVYFYDYVIPDDKQKIIFEFRGSINNKPIVSRGTIEPTFY
ncbi:hypothetical protein [Salibacterium lacus]|uniref:Uncharacterized protein n=1 Tax=Salibacterium lacus TaxID=1898109 RepID=A0ABW5SXW7_9BACI